MSGMGAASGDAGYYIPGQKKSRRKAGTWVTEGARTLDPQNHNLML